MTCSGVRITHDQFAGATFLSHQQSLADNRTTRRQPLTSARFSQSPPLIEIVTHLWKNPQNIRNTDSRGVFSKYCTLICHSASLSLCHPEQCVEMFMLLQLPGSMAVRCSRGNCFVHIVCMAYRCFRGNNRVRWSSCIGCRCSAETDTAATSTSNSRCLFRPSACRRLANDSPRHEIRKLTREAHTRWLSVEYSSSGSPNTGCVR